jgi:hypothetical protein
MRCAWTILLLAVCLGIAPVFVSAVVAQEAGVEAVPVAPPELMEPEPLPVEPVAPDFDFEAGVPANWTVAGEGAVLQVTQLQPNVAGGLGALECVYVPVCMISAGDLIPQPNARSLRFSLKTTEPTNLTYSVREVDGSEYQSFCYVPGAAWQQMALNLDEFVLAQGSDDENGQIDPDQINSLVVGDLANMPGEVGEALGQKMGQQMLWLDDVKLSPDPAPSRAGAAGLAGLVLDTFDAPQVNCLAIGGAELSPTPAGLQATYSLGAGRWVGLVTGAGHLDLAGAASVKMRVRAPQATSIVLVLEERDGTKYETRLELAGGQQWDDLTFPIANFILDDDSQDENGALDLPQVRVAIVLADMLTSGVDVLGKGSLVIDEIAFQAQ